MIRSAVIISTVCVVYACSVPVMSPTSHSEQESDVEAGRDAQVRQVATTVTNELRPLAWLLIIKDAAMWAALMFFAYLRSKTHAREVAAHVCKGMKER